MTSVSSPYAGVHHVIGPSSSISLRISPVRGGSPQIIDVTAIEATYLPRTRGFTWSDENAET